MDEQLGSVGGYQLVRARSLARVAWAWCTSARQPGVDRLVALKQLQFGVLGDVQLAERFIEEARIGASLAHQNIVTMHEYFEEQGAAEHCHGVSSTRAASA